MRRTRRSLLVLVAAAVALLPLSPVLAARAPLVNTVPDDHCGSNGTKPSLILWTKVKPTSGLNPGPVGLYEKACTVDNTARANGAPQRLPLEANVVEPGQQLAVKYTKTFSRAAKPIHVEFKGSGLTFNKTLTGVQKCGNTGVCSGWETEWVDALITHEVTGYFIVSTTDEKGATEKACFQTFRAFCPEKF